MANKSIKMGKYLNENFTKEDIRMANKHMKKCSTSSGFGDFQTKPQ